MFRSLFFKPAGIEVQPDGAHVHKWQRRSFRNWLIIKLIGKRAVLANQTIRTEVALCGSDAGFLLFGNTMGEGGKLQITCHDGSAGIAFSGNVFNGGGLRKNGEVNVKPEF